MEVKVNEIKKNIIFVCIIIMLIITIFVLGKNLYNNGNRIKEAEKKLSDTIGKLQSLETGIEYCSRESIERGKINRSLRNENIRYRESENRITRELEKTLIILRNTTTELDRIRRKNSKGIKIIINSSEGIETGIVGIEETIKEIEKNKFD